MINQDQSKDKVAIVVVGYNKPGGLRRLLNSLNNAVYKEIDIPLVISIDASGNQDVYSIAEKFVWKHGIKYVNIEKERLGLKSHIFQCASLTKYFKGVIILEDDIFVSPFFYQFAVESLDYYGNDEKIAGIALYNEEINGYVGLPFQPVYNGGDTYAWQTVCSWGEVWNERMWNSFSKWLSGWNEDFSSIDMMQRIKNWTRAWSKYYYAYMISTDRFFVYPYRALTTNFNDKGGEHGGGDSSIVQVSLLQGEMAYRFQPFNELVKYDVYGHNLDIPQWLGINTEDVTIDFYGLKDKYEGRYVLSSSNLPYKIKRGYALSMRPWELNIKYRIEGNDFFLYDKENSDTSIPPKRFFIPSMASYYLRGFNVRLLVRYVFNLYIKKVKKKIHLNG